MKNNNIVILISGGGTNLQAFIDAQKQSKLNGKIVAVLSNVASAYGIVRAKSANIPTITLEHGKFESREAFDAEMADKIDRFQPDVIVLAGFMRILGKAFVGRFRGKLLNIHPSLLPKYPGLDTHKKVLENKEAEHGTSVHFVTEKLDGGPVIAQTKTDVIDKDTETSLFNRIQSLEHQLYPKVVNWFLNGDVQLIQDEIHFVNKTRENYTIL